MSLERAVGTTDFTDGEDVLVERAFTRLPIGGQAWQVMTEDVPDDDQAFPIRVIRLPVPTRQTGVIRGF